MEILCRTGSNNCEVLEKSKGCSACRYQKCLDTGMTSSHLQVVYFINLQIKYLAIDVCRVNGKSKKTYNLMGKIGQNHKKVGLLL